MDPIEITLKFYQNEDGNACLKISGINGRRFQDESVYKAHIWNIMQSVNVSMANTELSFIAETLL